MIDCRRIFWIGEGNQELLSFCRLTFLVIWGELDARQTDGECSPRDPPLVIGYSNREVHSFDQLTVCPSLQSHRGRSAHAPRVQAWRLVNSAIYLWVNATLSS